MLPDVGISALTLLLSELSRSASGSRVSSVTGSSSVWGDSILARPRMVAWEEGVWVGQEREKAWERRSALMTQPTLFCHRFVVYHSSRQSWRPPSPGFLMLLTMCTRRWGLGIHILSKWPRRAGPITSQYRGLVSPRSSLDWRGQGTQNSTQLKQSPFKTCGLKRNTMLSKCVCRQSRHSLFYGLLWLWEDSSPTPPFLSHLFILKPT